MEVLRTRFVLLPGGRAPSAAAGRPRAAGTLRVIEGGHTAELELVLAEAIDAARQMRQEIERRIASALEAFEDRG
jgi:hypothetical protein